MKHLHVKLNGQSRLALGVHSLLQAGEDYDCYFTVAAVMLDTGAVDVMVIGTVIAIIVQHVMHVLLLLVRLLSTTCHVTCCMVAFWPSSSPQSFVANSSTCWSELPYLLCAAWLLPQQS